jgi:hypothetical protein
MSKSIGFGTLALAIMLAGLTGCSSKKPAVYERENFDDSGTFSRSYPVSETAACEAARRALLSQGYIITSNDPKLVSGRKSFQQSGENHLEISFNIVCTSNIGGDGGATVFANALQDHYALKKLNNSASLGVGVLGSVSMPIGSTSDSMVKVASETVASQTFYGRYFSLVESFLPPQARRSRPNNAAKRAPVLPTAATPPQQSLRVAGPVLPASGNASASAGESEFSSVPVPLPPQAAPITPVDTSTTNQPAPVLPATPAPDAAPLPDSTPVPEQQVAPAPAQAAPDPVF